MALLVALLLLSFVLTRANPISSPEIASISIKTNTQQPLHQQTTSKQQASAQPLTSLSLTVADNSVKSNAQEPHLNSLNAYASSYEASNSIYSNNKFKPSYKVSETETNFAPIQNNVATPIIMQYLPQSIGEAGATAAGGPIQYLQLIPTRPLIVPITPYMATDLNGPQATGYQAALTAPTNAMSEYAQKSQAMLSALHGNHPQSSGSTMLNMHYAAAVTPSNYGPALIAKNNNINVTPYRHTYRFNRETKDRHLPGGLTLNINEYLPGSGATTPVTYVRGRP